MKLPFLCETSNDLGIIPPLSIFDLYNYLRGFSDFDHESMRKFENMEGHQMFRDGHVNHIECGLFDNTKEYSFVVSHVKPRVQNLFLFLLSFYLFRYPEEKAFLDLFSAVHNIYQLLTDLDFPHEAPFTGLELFRSYSIAANPELFQSYL